MQIIQFKAEHTKMIKIQPMQAQDAERLKQVDLSPFEKMQSFTVINDDGEIVLICGIVPLWSGRVCLWSFFAEHSGKYFVRLVRLIKLYMDSIDATRIECYVAPEFNQARRLARILGFHYEGYLSRFNEDGSDSLMYAKVKE